MAKLQEQTKPYLLPLILGDVTAFDTTGQEVLSAWIAMFVSVAEHFDPYNVVSLQAERNHIRTTRRAPTNWKIWIGDYDKRNWAGMLVHFAVPISSEEYVIDTMDNGAPRPNTQTMIFVVGRLYVYVASSATDIFEDWHLVRTDLLKQIWPVKRNIIAWPPTATMTDRDADKTAAGFQRVSDAAARRMALESGSSS